MTFELSDTLTDEILSAMENQTGEFCVDAQTKSIVESKESDEERLYKIPGWSSADGFSMRETFVSLLHVPLAKEDLQETLHSGRGVFRNFRDVLKKYPEVEKRWHTFKYRTMRAVITEWYNQLCEVWGLEKLDSIPSSDEYLVQDDFSFTDYKSEDKEKILLNISTAEWCDDELPSKVTDAFYEMWKNQFERAEKIGQSGQICYSLSDEFAGCITYSPCLENQKNLVFVTSFYVSENFRGLGIGTELLSLSISRIKETGKKWVILPDFIIPEFLTPLLERMDFKKTRSGYILVLN
ncbi:MAG: UPF0158 family protein [Spirochaetales bacterium]|nr:UPF0158 family protein [Spirochaetales bacterium]